jgi:hypothetical protein
MREQRPAYVDLGAVEQLPPGARKGRGGWSERLGMGPGRAAEQAAEQAEAHGADPPGEPRAREPIPYRPDDATVVMDQPTASAPTRRPLNPWVARFAVFHFVVVGWIFFRAPDLGTALTYLSSLFTNWGVGTLVTGVVLLTIAVGMVGQFVPRRLGDALEFRASKLPPMVLAVGVGLWLVIINLLGPQGVAPFIYFQF